MSVIVNWRYTRILEDGCGGSIYKVVDQDNSNLKTLEMAMCIFSPSELSVRHHHDRIEEIYFILEGEGEILIGEEWHNIKPGDAIAIPIGVRHQIKNVSNEKELQFLSINSPEWILEDMILDDL